MFANHRQAPPAPLNTAGRAMTRSNTMGSFPPEKAMKRSMTFGSFARTSLLPTSIQETSNQEIPTGDQDYDAGLERQQYIAALPPKLTGCHSLASAHWCCL